MTAGDRRVAWLAPLLVGACAAIAAEVATAVLLYDGPGLVRSLTTVLAVEGAALAAGLWRGPAFPAGDLEALRRRWVFCLGAFVAAAAFGTAWSLVEEIGAGPLGQGLGLAVLAALPLYGCGLVLGGMGAMARGWDGGGEALARRDVDLALEHAPGAFTGAPAALGAAVGFVITGVLLPRAPLPASLLVGCLVMLSGAGLVFGARVGEGTTVRLRAVRASPLGDVRVEDRVSGRGVGSVRRLLEAGHERRRIRLDGEAADPWDVAFVRCALSREGPSEGEPEGPARVLVVGGGASALASADSKEVPDAVVVDVLERNASVVELAAAHMDGRARWDRVRVGNLEDLIAELADAYRVVLVDTGALAPLGGVAALSRAARSRLFDAVAPEGVIAFGPSAPPPAAVGAPEGWQGVVLRRPDAEVVLFTPGERAARWSWGAAGFAPEDGEVPRS